MVGLRDKMGFRLALFKRVGVKAKLFLCLSYLLYSFQKIVKCPLLLSKKDVKLFCINPGMTKPAIYEFIKVFIWIIIGLRLNLSIYFK